MKIYIALIKTDDNKPLSLVVREDAREMREYLLSIPAVYAVQSFAMWDSEAKLMKYYKLKDLVEFLKD